MTDRQTGFCTIKPFLSNMRHLFRWENGWRTAFETSKTVYQRSSAQNNLTATVLPKSDSYLKYVIQKSHILYDMSALPDISQTYHSNAANAASFLSDRSSFCVFSVNNFGSKLRSDRHLVPLEKLRRRTSRSLPESQLHCINFLFAASDLAKRVSRQMRHGFALATSRNLARTIFKTAKSSFLGFLKKWIPIGSKLTNQIWAEWTVDSGLLSSKKHSAQSRAWWCGP